jgi:hypothetical protein
MVCLVSSCALSAIAFAKSRGFAKSRTHHLVWCRGREDREGEEDHRRILGLRVRAPATWYTSCPRLAFPMVPWPDLVVFAQGPGGPGGPGGRGGPPPGYGGPPPGYGDLCLALKCLCAMPTSRPARCIRASGVSAFLSEMFACFAQDKVLLRRTARVHRVRHPFHGSCSSAHVPLQRPLLPSPASVER